MKTIGAAKFKEQCLALLDNLDAEGLIVTKHGKPVARIVPYDRQCADLIGSLRHKIAIRGDIFSTGVRWDADAQS
ncbi:MAG: type II toxin-antitoxin system prevent-host-death family antitoxin [Deltaproteobacteria bacterium]|nr:type II toxin-antitoxin system prevent-host-death family antitoxin [Deltaproteobacteria bacterium]